MTIQQIVSTYYNFYTSNIREVNNSDKVNTLIICQHFKIKKAYKLPDEASIRSQLPHGWCQSVVQPWTLVRQ